MGTLCQGLPSCIPACRRSCRWPRLNRTEGSGLNMWATVVNRDGVVCAVAFTGNTRGDQWPGSRVISAQKANTANAFSLPGLALSTANLYSASAARRCLYGLQASNPVEYGRRLWRQFFQLWATQRSHGRREDRWGECVRRRSGALQLEEGADRRNRGQRRFFLRRSQHCLEDTPRSGSRLGAERSERG